MKKIEEFYHEFKGYGIHDSRIKVHIYQGLDRKMVVFQDIGEGTSVTQSAEQLAKEILDLKELYVNQTIWVELYPYYDYSAAQIKFTFDQMSRVFRYPKWVPVSENILNLLKEIPDEKATESDTKE